MKEDKAEYYSLSEIVNITNTFFRYLLKKWWLMIVALLIGLGIGTIFFKKQQSKYQAVCTFILEEKSSGGGGLAGLASQFGFDIGGVTGGGSLFTGDNILNILSSRKVVQAVLLSPVNNETPSATLANLYLNSLQQNDQEKTFQNISFANNSKNSTAEIDSLLNFIYESFLRNNLHVERVSKQGSIIKVQVVSSNRDFARLMTERLVNEASSLYLDIRVGTAEKNIRLMQQRSDSLLALLNNKSYRAATSLPLDLNPGIKSAVVPLEIATRDKTVLATLYAEVTKNLEASKLLLSQQTPVIQVLDKPGYFLKDQKKSLLFILGLSALLTLILTAVGLFFLFIFKRVKERSKTATDIKI